MIIVDLSSLGSRGTILHGTSTAMVLGWSLAEAGDVNGDGIDDFIVGALRTDGGSGPGGAFVIYGKIGGIGALNLAALAPADGFFAQAPAGSNMAGEVVSGAGDIDGDGFDDILIGNGRHNNYSGRAFAVFGAEAGAGPVDLATMGTDVGFTITGGQSGTWTGDILSAAGDINNDGYDDFLVGGFQATTAWLLLGRGTGFANIGLSPWDPANGFTIVRGPNQLVADDFAGLGDFNGDGIDDFALALSVGNKVHVVFGKSSGFADINLANFTAADGFVISGANFNNSIGLSLSSAGDVNGDGLQDMIFSSGIGKVYVIFGRPGGAATIDLANLGSGEFIIQSPNAERVDGAGDVNGDGFDDLIVGALNNNSGGQYAGGAYVVFGKANATGTVTLATLPDSDGFFLQGDEAGDFGGNAVSRAGDVNGDGFGDVLVSATGKDQNGTSSGAAFLVYGAGPTSAVTRVGAAANQAIYGGDFDDMLDGAGGNDSLFGAGGNDILVGGIGADSMTGGSGSDLYHVDDVGDEVFEDSGAGTDEIRSSLAVQVLADNVENLTGTSNGGQTLTGNGLANTIIAGTGNDVIDGGTDADSMTGGAGNDIYYVDDLGDTVIELDGGGTDEVRTGLGSKTAPAYAVYVIPDWVENLTGTSAGAQGVRDNALNNVIVMAGGHDLIVADAGGVDSVDGGAGNDFIYYGATLTAADTVNGGIGTDTVGLLGDYSGGITFTASGLVGVERLALYTGGGSFSYGITMNDANVAAGGDFFVTAASLKTTETLFFNGAAETNGRFTVLGGSGGDTIIGGLSSDYLAGNAGDDLIYGLNGTDFIIGGLGADQLRGGGGADFFRYQSVAQSTTGSIDQILDFTHADRIDLSAIDSDGNAGNGETAFTFVGANAFSNMAGELRATESGGVWTVEGDTNGDGLADLIIHVTLAGPVPLGAGDFIL